jgi:hypothetical protein
MTASVKVCLGFILFVATTSVKAKELFKIPNDTETRWSSFEKY